MLHFKHFRGTGIVFSLIIILVCLSNTGVAQPAKPKNNLAAAIEFKETPLKAVIKNLAAQLKLNVVFDESFRDQPKYDLELNDVTLESALKIVLIHKHLMARVIEGKTIIIFYDNPANRVRFEKYPAWPFKYEQKR